MGSIAANNQIKADIKPPTNISLGERLLMRLMVKGKGTPFKEDEKSSADESNLNEDESKLSLT